METLTELKTFVFVGVGGDRGVCVCGGVSWPSSTWGVYGSAFK